MSNYQVWNHTSCKVVTTITNSRPRIDISMDFIEGLPLSHKSIVIFSRIDQLTKHAHFFTLVHHYIVVKVVQDFFTGLFRLHGMPNL